MAIMMALTITQPASDEMITELTMPRGTDIAADTLISETNGFVPSMFSEIGNAAQSGISVSHGRSSTRSAALIVRLSVSRSNIER